MAKVRLSMLFAGQIHPSKSPQNLVKRFYAAGIGFMLKML
jgi:hypothetical protein